MAKQLNPIDEMRQINLRQKTFYENDLALNSKGNLATRTWRKFRRTQYSVRQAIDVDRQVLDLHLQWMGDLTNKRVLDLGCYSGNALSMQIAKSCKSYLGIDLSVTAITELERKIRDLGLKHAQVRTVDFLSPEFGEDTYDIIYAYSVFHHFGEFEAFLKKIAMHLAPGGRIITHDPMNTAFLIKVARVLYRPFQSDAEWEWPFTKNTFLIIQKYFDIIAFQGILGKSKWAIPLSFFWNKMAIRMGKKWNEYDLEKSNTLGRDSFSCLQVSMCLVKRQ